ncbi:unnamed protein product [Sympodiomycopsis kandeliae]
MPSNNTHKHKGFRNAIRIRRNDGHHHRPHATPQADVTPFELQVVERAVQDERDEESASHHDGPSRDLHDPTRTRRLSNPNQLQAESAAQSRARPQFQRKSSLLEQIVQQDRQSAASASSSSSQQQQQQQQSTAHPPSFGKLTTSRSREPNASSNQGIGLSVLHEGDEASPTSPSMASPADAARLHPAYHQGSSLSTFTSAPNISSPARPGMLHSGPSSDRIMGLAPGPRFSYNNSQSFSADPQRQQTSTADHPDQSQASNYEEQSPTARDMISSSSTDDRTAKPGLLSNIIKRGRSYTLPSIGMSPSKKNNSDQTGKDGSPTQSFSDRQDDDRADDDGGDDGDSDSDPDMHEDGVVDYLDVVDAEVGVMNHMSNIQNSIFLPHIPALYDRRPTHAIPASTANSNAANRAAEARRRSVVSQESGMEEGRAGSASGHDGQSQPARPSVLSRMTSAMSFSRKTEDPEAAKHFPAWADMNEKERHELDEHVQFLLTRPQKFRRGLRGFGKWARTPMGAIMLTYGLAITGWGIVIMLFIWKWIDLHDKARQRWWIEICDQVLCALFAAVGLGFAPFRAVDTWRMCYIAHFHHLSWKRRKQLNLPKLQDRNDLPRPKGYNEAFPKPVPLDQITEESSEMLSPRDSTRTGSQWTPSASGPLGEQDSSRESSEVGDQQGEYGFVNPKSSGSRLVTPQEGVRENVDTPGGRSRSSTTTGNSSRPSALAQAISNRNPPSAHRWWHLRSKKEKADARTAAAAALEAVEAVSPSSENQQRPEHQQHSNNVNEATSDEREKPTMNDTRSTPPPSGRPVPNRDDLTLQRKASIMSELEKEREDVVVLTPQEQAKLEHHQRKFHESHTFYRYHETATHRAFPLDLMIVIVCLLDCHSLLQGSLGGVTWGINYHHRPTALTATLITCSLSCNAVAGFLIYLGGRKTKKVEEVQKRIRIALEEEAYRDLLMIQKQQREQTGTVKSTDFKHRHHNRSRRHQQKDAVEVGEKGGVDSQLAVSSE